MLAVELDGSSEAVAQPRHRTPADGTLEQRRVGVEIADVDHLLLRRPFDQAEAAAARYGQQQLDQVEMRDRLGAANVERQAVASVAGAGPEKCIRGVVDIDEVAQLAAVAVDLDLA